MFNDIRGTLIDDVESFNAESNLKIDNPTLEELNIPISQTEVRDAIKNLNRNKASCPSDNLLNEYFIESLDILVDHITDMFNKVFDAGHFPEIWSSCFIVPLHKKGNRNDPNNYRYFTK
jgi:hypothetical protein